MATLRSGAIVFERFGFFVVAFKGEVRPPEGFFYAAAGCAGLAGEGAGSALGGAAAAGAGLGAAFLRPPNLPFLAAAASAFALAFSAFFTLYLSQAVLTRR